MTFRPIISRQAVGQIFTLGYQIMPRGRNGSSISSARNLADIAVKARSWDRYTCPVRSLRKVVLASLSITGPLTSERCKSIPPSANRCAIASRLSSPMHRLN